MRPHPKPFRKPMKGRKCFSCGMPLVGAGGLCDDCRLTMPAHSGLGNHRTEASRFTEARDFMPIGGSE